MSRPLYFSPDLRSLLQNDNQDQAWVPPSLGPPAPHPHLPRTLSPWRFTCLLLLPPQRLCQSAGQSWCPPPRGGGSFWATVKGPEVATEWWPWIGQKGAGPLGAAPVFSPGGPVPEACLSRSQPAPGPGPCQLRESEGDCLSHLRRQRGNMTSPSGPTPASSSGLAGDQSRRSIFNLPRPHRARACVRHCIVCQGRKQSRRV